MKTKVFKHGTHKFKAYLKPVGRGYEVGFLQGTKSLFVGNFINDHEAHAWYQLMGREFSRFSRRFGPTPPKGNAFYYKFITNSMYKHYYDYLDKCFGKYTKTYHREFQRDIKTFNRMRKHWDKHSINKEVPYLRRAA